MAQIAIVGAGVAGLAAGRTLAGAGHAVTVFEQSSRVGGRVLTRRVEGCAIDLGANYFKAPSAELQALVTELPGAVDIELPVWTFDAAGSVAPGDPEQNAEAKWTWPGGLDALPTGLARGLDVRYETRVVQVVQGDTRRPTTDHGRPMSPVGKPLTFDDSEVGTRAGRSSVVGRRSWLLIDASGAAHGPYDALLLTPPAAESGAIIEASKIAANVRAELLAALAPVRYRRCISVALAYPHRPAVPWYALVNSDRRHPISWLACEHVKPGRAPAGVGLLMAQMAPEWSERHWEALPEGTYAGQLPDAVLAVHTLLRPLLGAELGAPLWADVQRWRYALPDAACGPAPTAERAGIYLAGDMLMGQGRIHLAIESGWATARRIMSAGTLFH